MCSISSFNEFQLDIVIDIAIDVIFFGLIRFAIYSETRCESICCVQNAEFNYILVNTVFICVRRET